MKIWCRLLAVFLFPLVTHAEVAKTAPAYPAYNPTDSLGVAYEKHVLNAICFVENQPRNPTLVNWKDKGAPSIGYCGVKLKTARGYGFKGPWKELLVREVNEKYALAHLQACWDKFGSEVWAIACYNAGEPVTAKWVARKRVYPGNAEYVGRVYTALEILSY